MLECPRVTLHECKKKKKKRCHKNNDTYLQYNKTQIKSKSVINRSPPSFFKGKPKLLKRENAKLLSKFSQSTHYPSKNLIIDLISEDIHRQSRSCNCFSYVCRVLFNQDYLHHLERRTSPRGNFKRITIKLEN